METRSLIIRGDDLGLSHAINQGYRRLAERGMITAWSIMAPCPWFMEAVEVAKEYPNVDLGMHLTLNAEWQGYRWGPVLGPSRVPSLVDSFGYFHPNPLRFLDNPLSPSEVEAELRAQVERVLKAGLNLRYVDNSHCNCCAQFPMINEITNRIIADYKLQVSPFVFDPTTEVIASAPPTPAAKLEAFTQWLALSPASEGYRFILVHAHLDTPEARALVLNSEFAIPFLQEFVPHAIAETEALCTDEFQHQLQRQGYRLVRYRDLPSNQQLRELPLMPREIVMQMFAMFGASPELLAKLDGMR